jgi:NarL family two-component system sensor histidine kinase YdfH
MCFGPICSLLLFFAFGTMIFFSVCAQYIISAGGCHRSDDQPHIVLSYNVHFMDGKNRPDGYNGFMANLYQQFRMLLKDERKPGYEVPFLIFLTLVLVGVTFVNVYQAFREGQSGMGIFFIFLSLVSIGLHWLAPKIFLSDQKSIILIYLLVQTSLAFVLTVFSLDAVFPVTGFGFFLSLIGEAYGSLKTLPEKNGTVGFLLVISLGAWWVNMGIEEFWSWALGMLPSTAFIVIYISLYSQQATAKEAAQKLLEDLRLANHKLAESAREVETLTLMTERQRMARELHDTLAQGLAGIILQMEAADSYLDNQQAEKAQEIIRIAMGRARQTLAESREVIDDLRKKAYDPESFASWIYDEVDDFIKVTGVYCQVDVQLPPYMPVEMQLAIQRLLGEGLTNIKKHAAAGKVWLSVKMEESSILVTIRDDGCGFNPEDVLDAVDRYGLLGIRERVSELGGWVSFESEPGEGTIIQVGLPLAGRKGKD